MTQRLGKAYIKVDAGLLETMPGAKLDPGGVTRTTVVGNNRVLGYSTKPKQARLECQIALGSNTSLEALGKIENATITFECDTGQTYTLRNAWLTDTPNVTDGDGGQVPLIFEAPPAEEMGV